MISRQYNVDKKVTMRPAFQSKNQIIHGVLLDAIIQGEFPPSTRLIIDELAAKFEVSPIPIREALRQLEADGFVSFEPHVGFTVTPIHAGLVTEVFALLESMEIVSSCEACQRMSDADLDTIATLINKMDDSMSDPIRWSQDNKTLHQFICECAQMWLIKKMMQKALDHWNRLQVHYFKDVFSHRVVIAQQEHRAILDAFRSRDPKAVERVIRSHNQAALDAYLRYLNSSVPLASES
ncbi:MAG: GntR family transcriptional regulator [Anaerolineae bacterium]|nr:GntR family transcriptional regulator [Anaerolineae bacterium]